MLSLEGSLPRPCRLLDSPVWASGREVLAGEKHLSDVSLWTGFKTRAQVRSGGREGRESKLCGQGRQRTLSGEGRVGQGLRKPWVKNLSVWQKSSQYCKAIILQLKINKGCLNITTKSQS